MWHVATPRTYVSCHFGRPDSGMTADVAANFPCRVGVLSSPGADHLVAKNGLACADLLQPFTNVAADGHVRDPTGGQYTVKNFKLTFSDVNAKPPQPTLARKYLNESVAKNYSDRTAAKTIGKFQLDIPASTPWFDAWRETFFQVQFPSDHEFTKHFVACLLMVSSLEANPSETMSHMTQQLTQMQSVTPPKLPKWFNANTLRCYVLLHDSAEGNAEKTRRNFESLKQAYGSGNCFLLAINSRDPKESENCVLPDPWSKYLIRRIEVTDSGSEKDSSPRTPADMASITNLPITVELGSREEINSGSMSDVSNIMCESATEASESGAITVQIHPLSPSEEAETALTFNSGNTLQIDAMTNSIVTESGLMNSNVWEQSSISNMTSGGTHGTYLSTQDIENIKAFVQDFALKALLPYFERQIFQLHDVVANKKGVSRSILNATKRWFGTNKPGTNVPINSVIYTGDCAELQLRRLGDIWFMLGQWNLAFQTYHTAKREYNADGAWLCYAGALEMAALSAFMANESTKKTFEYMEESIIKYMSTCRMPQYAVRATLLSVQCLCNRGLYGEAARQLIRMTSEDCDLRSAVLLEQAALCFLAEPARKALPRKYAFHMVLAGHRYSKAGQRKHSLRCYKQAYQIYRGGGWRLATDHIEFAVGRLAGQVRAWDASASALSSLLAPRSLQPPTQQAAFLREYLHILHQWIPNDSEQSSLPQLPIPLLESSSTAVLCGGISPVSSPGRLVTSGASLNAAQPTDKTWIHLEKMLVQKAKGTQMIFKPTISLYCNMSDNSSSPISPQNELIQIQVHLQNPLQIDISLTDVQLLWNFKSESAIHSTDFFSNENCIISSSEYDKSVINTQKVPVVHLQNDKVTAVTLSLTPLHPGELNIVGVAYKLSNPVNSEEKTNGTSVLGKQIFKIKGPKLKQSKETAGESLYDVDHRLKIIVVPPSPCLQVTFSEINNQLLCGELQRVVVEFKNVGRVPLKALYMGLSHPQYVSLSIESDKNSYPFTSLLEYMYSKPPVYQDERQLIAEKERKARNRHCTKVLDNLDSGQTYSTILWLQAPERIGNHKLQTLFYYENSQSDSLLKYRLLRHSWNIAVKDSVNISVLPKRSLKLNTDKTLCKESMNLSIEVTNTNQIHHGILTSLEVQQVSLLSQSWTLNTFVPISQDAKVLGSQETLHLVMCALRSTVDRRETEVLHSDMNLLSNDSNLVSIKERPYSNFVTCYFSMFDRDDLMNDAYATLNNLYLDDESINSTVVVRWKADITVNGGAQRIAVGQHRVLLDKLNVKMSSSGCVEAMIKSKAVVNAASSSSDEKLVTFCLEHPLEVTHDFKKQHVCMIPVRVHLVNCSSKTLIAMLNTSSHKSGNPCITWVGLGGNECGGLQVSLTSLQSDCITLQIACTCTGTYSLGDIIRVLCKIKHDEVFSEPILQSHSTISTLIVSQC